MKKEIKWLANHKIANSMQDALGDIKAGSPMKCLEGLGYAGYSVPILDGYTNELDGLPTKMLIGFHF